MAKRYYTIKCRLCGRLFGAVTATDLHYKHGRDNTSQVRNQWAVGIGQ